MTITRRTTFFLLAFAALVVVVAGAVRVFILNPDAYHTRIVAYLEAKTGRQVDVGRVALGWHSASVELYDFGIRDPEPFPPGYFFRARRVEVHIRIASLLRRRMVIDSILLEDPVINVISDPDGLWNFETPRSQNSAAPSFTPGVGTIGKITLVRGQLNGSSLIDPSDRPGPVVFQIRDLSASLTNVNFRARSTAQQPSVVAQGNLSARSLQFGSVDVRALTAKLHLAGKKVSFNSIDVAAAGGRGSGEVTFDLAGRNAQFRIDASLVHIDVARLLSSFPGATGKMTGIMHGRITLEGPIEHTFTPLADLRGRGTLTVENGQLPGLNSNASLKQMMRFRPSDAAGKPASAFSSLSSDLELTKKRMTNRDIDVAFYGFDVDCAGYLDLGTPEKLHYSGVAKVLKKQGLITNVFAELFHEARNVNGKLDFPLQITGTLANPKFSAVD